MENLSEYDISDIIRYIGIKKRSIKPLHQYFTGISGKKYWRLTRCIYCNYPRAWTIVNKDGNFYHFSIFINCTCY